jgi:AraC family transcriptional regulator
MITASAEAHNDFERPPFLARERMEKSAYLHPSPSFGGMSAGLYQSASIKLGLISDANLCESVYLLPILLQGVPAHEAWKDSKHFHTPRLPIGSISSYHMVYRWELELWFPFHSVHFYIPQSSFNDLTRELHVAPVERLSCVPDQVTQDSIAYYLACAIAPLIEAPVAGTSLLSDQILAAIRLHVALRYGGLDRSSNPSGMLSPVQVDLLQALLLDDPTSDVRLHELAIACALPLRQFQKRFRRTFGCSPYQWRLERKVERARKLIDFSSRPLVEIADLCGFADQSHLTRTFTRIVGIPPARYRRLRRS